MCGCAHRLALIGAALVVLCTPAAAHQSSVTYVTADLDGANVHVRVRLAPRDLAEELGDTHAPREPAALIAARAAAIVAHVTAHVEIQDGDTPCPPASGATAVDGDRVAVTFTAACPAPPARLILDYGLLFELDRNHTAALRVRVPGRKAADTLLSVDAARFNWLLSEPPPSGSAAFIREGMHHVATGFDHVAFVLALLLAVVLTRGASGWQVRRLGPALRTTAGVVSAFTIAHSLTLIAAALGWVELPGRLVEATIAASIVFTAAASVVRPDAAWRLATAFGFGLIHGLGFARMLAALLPPHDVVVPLLCFNLGVELAQLAIVAVAVPLVWLLARALGAARYRRVALPALAAPLALLGFVWLIERLADVTLLGL